MGYVHVNQDTLKTRDKCVKAAQEALREGKSCVIGRNYSFILRFVSTIKATDNTNRNAATRKFYLDVAKTLNIPTRSVTHFFFCLSRS